MPASTSAANAAIWFLSDGYVPGTKAINGRRVAGQSFLRGFFAHAEVDEFVALTHSQTELAAFTELARAAGVTMPIRGVRLDTPDRMRPTEVVSYPSPLDPIECWRRAPYGHSAWAINGITHTISTSPVMQKIYDLRSAPQMPWDAITCTSQAVQRAVRNLMELAESHLAQRFPGTILPARPLLPVIPLGITCDDFARDPSAGRALRDRLGIAPEDVLAVTVARLTPDEKFDPLPLFIAMEAAEAEVRRTGGTKLHLVFCGQFRVEHWRTVFDRAAAELMPSCSFHILDGGDAGERKAVLSSADIFVFPVDNVQETFGLAPIEAMAAGVPVIVSDWDGLRDTVTADIGFRIPTEMPSPGTTTYLSQRYLGGTDGYLQYVGQLAAMTRLDIQALTAAIVSLASDPGLRARMGAAARDRARRQYDWSAIIPQVQALWAEQSAMLVHARTKGGPQTASVPAAQIPVGPAPDLMFSGYASTLPPATRRLRTVILGSRPGVAETLKLRDYGFSRRLIEYPERFVTILAAFGLSGSTVEEVAVTTGLPQVVVERVTLWLLKYHFLEECP